MSVTSRDSAKRRARFVQPDEDSATELEEFAEMLGMDLADFFYPFSEFIVFEDVNTTPEQSSGKAAENSPKIKHTQTSAVEEHKPIVLQAPGNTGPSVRPHKMWNLPERAIEIEPSDSSMEACTLPSLQLAEKTGLSCSGCINRKDARRALIAVTQDDSDTRHATLQRWRVPEHHHRPCGCITSELPRPKTCLAKGKNTLEDGAGYGEEVSNGKNKGKLDGGELHWRPHVEVVTVESEKSIIDIPVEVSAATVFEESVSWHPEDFRNHFGLHPRSAPHYSGWMDLMAQLAIDEIAEETRLDPAYRAEGLLEQLARLKGFPSVLFVELQLSTVLHQGILLAQPVGDWRALESTQPEH
ncbi:hypothetical protein cyc_03557 [Cyclospora cayetanensis]|uniref:Uncharacterized protein n=1 Tax=Cyclospora cayetanensis TaxID=88456 RepID=A0A1D3CW45_9EIME|nr:hypothetical protein cyc_03557 [Cyclospora cayetanensis]